MGGHAYWYHVPFEADAQHALDALRAREFQAGRYNPVLWRIDFTEPAFSAQTPGAQHASIADALDASESEGTRSILDISQIADAPDFCVAAPLTEEELDSLFGTAQPTHAQALGSDELLEMIERGHCRYLTLFENGTATELFFVGYSFD